MEGLHELLGILTLCAGLGAVACGVIIYRFVWFKNYLGNRRPLFHQWHFFLSSTAILFLLGHYFTTNKQNIFLIVGSILTGVIYSAGLSFRVSKRLMKKIVTIKIVLLLTIALLLPIGHSLVENHEKDHGMNAPGAYHDE